MQAPLGFCSPLFLLLSTCVLVSCGLRYISRRQSLPRIPGPFLARWTNLWLAFHAHRGRRYIVVHKAHQRYGVFVRIGPNHVSISSPDALSVVYGQGPRAPSKSAYYDAFVCNGNPSIFSTRDRRDHSTKRRAMSHVFSSSALEEFVPLIHSTLGQFMLKMDVLCEAGEFFDLLPWLNYLAFDILSDLAFGEPIGMLQQGSDVVSVHLSDNSLANENAIALVDKREHFAAVAGIESWIPWVTKYMPFLSGIQAATSLEQLAHRQVLRRLSSFRNRNDILGKLINARGCDARSPNAAEIAGLTAESVTLLVAGSDTTSNSIAVILHFIITNPPVYDELLRVLLDATSDSNEPGYEQVKNIPYLQAVINEGLRLHSITAIGLPRSAPSGGLVCCGLYFPEGTELSVPAWTISHDAELWGDPDTFRPQRWLEQKELRQYLLAFGKGPRACIGQNLAYIEMTSVIAAILLKYKIEVRSPELTTIEGFMHKPLHMWIKLSRR
ncbi:benzoate para-hydroxylase [Mycena metata]|uniref:Benzoate para-hydroxylase n=1 Tax=Mycena metata TaxID=1033252 RepID=A0AAD7MJC0_9AGAR|nr:benzoate para-hydroxylase [Mycena metata]